LTKGKKYSAHPIKPVKKSIRMDKLKVYRLVPIIIVIFYALYNLPFMEALMANNFKLPDLLHGYDNIITPLSRSLLFGVAQALLYCLFSLFFSSILFSLKIADKKSRFLTLLLFPFLIGNVSVAFIFKLIFVNSDFVINKYLLLSIMCLWQYGTLFTYLFWLNQQTIPSNKVTLYKTSNLTQTEIFRDIVLPKQKNLLILTFIVGFVFSIYEDFKLKLLFKASRGTGTELVNSWINRNYISDTLSNTRIAFDNLSTHSAFTLITSLMILWICSIIVLAVLVKASKLKHIVSFNFKNYKLLSNIGLIILLFCIFLPFIIVLPNFFSFKMVSLFELFTTVGLTTLIALIAASIAVIVGYFLRLCWSATFQTFNRKTVVLIALNFILLLSPPILILILGFQWMKWLGYSSSLNVYLAWSSGQILYVLPILIAFAIVTHFRVRQNDVNYLLVHHVGYSNIAKNLFWSPFKGEYLLLFIFAFSSIWNESTINTILSDTIPSFATELNKTIIGRSTDYSSGLTYLLFSFLIGFVCLVIWDRLLVSNYKSTIG
jgi:hypothetical protein